MGKFGIGARVRDEDGDEGVIVDKRKGERRVRFDKSVTWGGDTTLWMNKSNLTAIGPQFGEGDRVQLIADNDLDNTLGIGRFGRAGDVGVVESFDENDFTYFVNINRLGEQWWVKATNLRPFVAVENAETNVSGTDGGRENAWQPKVGDRVKSSGNRWTDYEITAVNDNDTVDVVAIGIPKSGFVWSCLPISLFTHAA